ncbi:hypothetical protein CLU79DRAFT_572498 [Phycomyces nitens]|nr:hypothetical protein CLU79DRAFT_572498 [Phycomyces nitens]
MASKDPLFRPLHCPLSSCVTNDSTDSFSISTPLDVSPAAPHSSAFSIITVVSTDDFTPSTYIPSVAATVSRYRQNTNDPAQWDINPSAIPNGSDSNQENSMDSLIEQSNGSTSQSTSTDPMWIRIRNRITKKSKSESNVADPERSRIQSSEPTADSDSMAKRQRMSISWLNGRERVGYDRLRKLRT